MILHGDSLDELKKLEDNSIDLVCTDPPYAISFMGKSWDKALPSVEVWKECLRVLKPGAFAFVMSAPRSDVCSRMAINLEDAGFRIDFTPIYWTYASGFPKAGNIGKLVDKRLGVEREVTGTQKLGGTARRMKGGNFGDFGGEDTADVINLSKATSPEAKALDGSYAGFQPKPAVEVIIVAMKPLSEKTFVDQALKNGKGISWLDDCRVPSEPRIQPEAGYIRNGRTDAEVFLGNDTTKTGQTSVVSGRFPANLLVSDDVLNDGTITRQSVRTYRARQNGKTFGGSDMAITENIQGIADSGSYSRYFDLDKWASTLPFLIVPKASKREKNEGLEHMPTKAKAYDYGSIKKSEGRHGENTERANHHPTVKPLKLMSYLITLGSRPGDTVPDPFCGSGTTIVAAEALGRNGIGIEREAEYVEIAEARVAHEKSKVKQTELV